VEVIICWSPRRNIAQFSLVCSVLSLIHFSLTGCDSLLHVVTISTGLYLASCGIDLLLSDIVRSMTRTFKKFGHIQCRLGALYDCGHSYDSHLDAACTVITRIDVRQPCVYITQIYYRHVALYENGIQQNCHIEDIYENSDEEELSRTYENGMYQ